MSLIKISVILLIKNGEKYLQYLNKYFNKIEKKYQKNYIFEYFFYENDSNDNTKNELSNFFKNRKGKYWSEKLEKKDKTFDGGINNKRCSYMTYLRRKLKKKHGILNSDYTLLIDCDVIYKENFINKYIELFNYYIMNINLENSNSQIIRFPVRSHDLKKYSLINNEIFRNLNIDIIKNKKMNITKIDNNIKNKDLELLIKRKDNNISFKLNYSKKGRFIRELGHSKNIVAVSCFDACAEYNYNEKKNYLHYYDSLAFVDNNNNYAKLNGNTCLYSKCERCINHRKVFNIKFETPLLSCKKISKVKSAFGGALMIKTYVYNKVNWDCNDTDICEHHSLCKNIRNYGNIIVDPTFFNSTTTQKYQNFNFISKDLLKFDLEN